MNLAHAVPEYDATTFETPEYAPALHTHAAAEVAPGAEVVPAGHETHAVEEFAPAVTEYVPAGQLIHDVDALAPAVAEYVPATHARQSDVLFTQLFSCADAWRKSALDR
jgi:hypothetical protein